MTDVWLRRNIIHDYRDEPDGTAQEFWSADEAHGTMPAGTTAEQVKAEFDLLWEVFEREAMDAQGQIAASIRDAMAAQEVLGGAGTDNHAPDNISEGELFVAGGAAYVALENLARGERLREGGNVRRTTVTEYVTELAKEA